MHRWSWEFGTRSLSELHGIIHIWTPNLFNYLLHLYLTCLPSRESKQFTLFSSSFFSLQLPCEVLQAENISLAQGHPTSIHGRAKIWIWVSRILVWHSNHYPILAHSVSIVHCTTTKQSNIWLHCVMRFWLNNKSKPNPELTLAHSSLNSNISDWPAFQDNVSQTLWDLVGAWLVAHPLLALAAVNKQAATLLYP